MSIANEKGRAPAKARPNIAEGAHSKPLDPAPAREIVLHPEAFDQGYDVMLVLSPAAGPIGREFTSYRRAAGFAEGLSAALGLPVRDTTGRGE